MANTWPTVLAKMGEHRAKGVHTGFGSVTDHFWPSGYQTGHFGFNLRPLLPAPRPETDVPGLNPTPPPPLLPPTLGSPNDAKMVYDRICKRSLFHPSSNKVCFIAVFLWTPGTARAGPLPTATRPPAAVYPPRQDEHGEPRGNWQGDRETHGEVTGQGRPRPPKMV